ncbi:MAG TPA: riboflavin synthase [Candidatus Omnitrophota bacterium]|nr:riboflavin synthase [Candidatus Omnitrophota bacterium]
MFTGLIEEQGRVEVLEKKSNLFVLKISAPKIFKGTKLGNSISIDGVCLTVVKIKKPRSLSFEMMKETIEKTTMQDLKPGSLVNLERALKAGSRMGGHFVTGHADGVGTVQKIVKQKNYAEFQISLDKNLKRFLVPKGSVTIDGVSLTLGEVNPKFFSIHLIPYTLKLTTLGTKKEGDRVNIETDVLAKYILSRNF